MCCIPVGGISDTWYIEGIQMSIWDFSGVSFRFREFVQYMRHLVCATEHPDPAFPTPLQQTTNTPLSSRRHPFPLLGVRPILPFSSGHCPQVRFPALPAVSVNGFAFPPSLFPPRSASFRSLVLDSWFKLREWPPDNASVVPRSRLPAQTVR